MDQTLDLYKFYLADLQRLYEGYYRFEITESIAAITATGWFLTSSKAQKLLSFNKNVAKGLTTTIVIMAICELIAVCQVKSVSSRVFILTKHFAERLCPSLPPAYYNYRLIGWDTLILFYLFHVLLLSSLVYIINKASAFSEVLNSVPGLEEE